MATTTHLLTYDDLCRMPDDGNRYELIGGELVASPAPSRFHQEALTRLLELLRAHVLPRRLGWVYPAPLDVHLGPHEIDQPDLIFVSRERASILIDNGTEGAPDLVVEVLSRSTRRRDLGVKLDLYAASGVQEYWAVDLELDDVMQYALRDGRLERVPIVGRILRSIVLPGLEIDLDLLFDDFDEPVRLSDR
ncbi:MAG: Uma2 family endonuclease [Thermomicrobiales bacterium]